MQCLNNGTLILSFDESIFHFLVQMPKGMNFCQITKNPITPYM